MSVFRPLNSDESNLFTIRCVIAAHALATADTVLVDNDSTSAATSVTTSLIAPTINNLPPNFRITQIVNGDSNYYELEYGKTFTSPPCIMLTPKSTSSSVRITEATEVLIPNIVQLNLTTAAGTTNAEFCFRLATDATLKPAENGFDIMITGPVKLGVTTGNSNKGWNIGSGNDSSTAYSYMNVGIGTGNPTSALQVQGRLDSFFYKAVEPSTGPGATNTITAAQTVCEVLNCTPSDPFTLTTLTAAEIIAAMLSEKSHTAAVNDAFDLVINNLATSSANVITLVGDTNISISGNEKIYGMETAKFRFICTNVGSGTEAVTIVRV